MLNSTVVPKDKNKFKPAGTGIGPLQKENPAVITWNHVCEEHPFPVLIADAGDFSIVNANKAACAFYGYIKKNFLKLKLTDIDAESRQKSYLQLLKVYKQKKFVAKHKLKNGEEIEVEVFNSTFAAGERTFFSLAIVKLEQKPESVTEKEKQLEDLKLRFLSTSSHEFRTPLTTILTSSEVLLMIGRSLSEEKFDEYIIQIQNAVIYMTSLLDDILTINKTETGKWKFSPGKVDLLDFCNKMIEEAQNIAAPNHTFKIYYESKNNHAILDKKLLHHILSNLLSNAVKYSPDGGEITMRVRNTESEIEFIISDNGIGISKKDQNKLFETFYRGENIGKIEGTGLGLSIVKRCVESHGGKISFRSKVNNGSVFTVSLPLMTVI